MNATTVVDNYATRNGDRCERVERVDPVVWGPGTVGPLSAPDLVRYEDKGFHNIVEALSVSEVASCYAEINRLANSVDLQDDPRVVREKRSGEVRTIFDVHLLSEVAADIARRPDLLATVRQILGSDVYVHQSRLNFKPGFIGGPFYWHSDFETWHAEDGMPAPRAVSISLALTPNYEVNGGLMILPGSHRSFISCGGDTPSDYYKKSLVNDIPETGTPDHETLTSMADEFGIEQMVGPAGSATLFDSNCMHGSNGNITPYSRSNLFIVYNSVDNTLGDPYAAPSPRPEFLAKHDFTALQPA